MAMTKKDYIVLAEAFRHSAMSGDDARRQWACTRHWIMQVLRDDNPRFDTDRFIMATNAPVGGQ